MTKPAPVHHPFDRLAQFNWAMAKLRDAVQPRITILHSLDGSDLSALSLAVQVERILVHRIDPNSDDPALAFFARFAKSLAAPLRGKQNHPLPMDLDLMGEAEALHLFADPGFTPAQPLRGTRILAPLLSAESPPGDAAWADFEGFRPLRIGGDIICAVAGLSEKALARLQNRAGGWEDGETLELPTPDLPPRRILAIPAERLVHDGGYRAESDGEYSWLWSGPDPNFRLMLGKMPFRPARLSLIVACEGAAGNLEQSRLFLNGEWRESRAERWAGGGGRLSVDLHESCGDPVVLSVDAPSMPEIAGRKLGLSIAQLEIGEAS
jgi:hypothetical protein